MNRRPLRRPTREPRRIRAYRTPRSVGVATAMSAAVLSKTFSSAAAESERTLAAMEYTHPIERKDCPSADAIARSIAVRLGYEPIVPSSDRHLLIAIRTNGKTLEAVVRFERPDAPAVERTRVSSSGDCAELAEVAALTAATLLDPRAVFAGKRTAENVPPSPPPGATRSLDFQEPSEPKAQVLLPSFPSPTWRIRVGARTLGCLGCAPRPNAGVGIVVGAERARWGIDFGGRWDLPASAIADDGSGVSTSLLLFELFPHATFGPVRLGPVGAVGTLSGKSVGIEGRDRDNSLWASAGARVGVEFRFAGPLVAFAYLDGALAISRVHLVVRGVERWSSGPVASTASLGVLAAF